MILKNSNFQEIKAIALDFDWNSATSSKIEGLGLEKLAREMIRAANRYGIDIINNQELTDFLFTMGVNQEIPSEISSIIHRLLSVTKA